MNYSEFKRLAISRGYRVGTGETPESTWVLERHARDRNARRFRSREEAIQWLHMQPEQPRVRY
jgi:hypothetical protein